MSTFERTSEGNECVERLPYVDEEWFATVGIYEDETVGDFLFNPVDNVSFVPMLFDDRIEDFPENRDPVIDGVFSSSKSKKEELLVGITLNSRTFCNLGPDREEAGQPVEDIVANGNRDEF